MPTVPVDIGGDIHGLVHGCDGEFAWRVGLTALGTVLSFATAIIGRRTLDEFQGRSGRRQRAARLLAISFLAGSAPVCLGRTSAATLSDLQSSARPVVFREVAFSISRKNSIISV
jgi:hypothetical protein